MYRGCLCRTVDSKQISSISSTSIVELTVKALENTISQAYSYASRLKNVETGYFSTSKSRIVDYSHLNQHDPDFDSDSCDSSGEEDEDTTGNCTDNEDSTENDENYVSIIIFSKLVRLHFKE
ncbi:unnamed protein product [Rotaria socialis]|uniref:Uncharacterized protein n=1 Tax=Rotaria socialis TaxID=392032 RepID=A0A820Y7M7_9BILA|nr:unnamed protein product [Rotaria socialis]